MDLAVPNVVVYVYSTVSYVLYRATYIKYKKFL